MKHTKLYRMIVLAVCLISIMCSMLACDGGDGCYWSDTYQAKVCPTNVIEQPSITDQAKQTIEQVNSNISQDTSAWVSQHSAGEWSRDCMSVWSQTCETSGAYNK